MKIQMSKWIFLSRSAQAWYNPIHPWRRRLSQDPLRPPPSSCGFLPSSTGLIGSIKDCFSSRFSEILLEEASQPGLWSSPAVCLFSQVRSLTQNTLRVIISLIVVDSKAPLFLKASSVLSSSFCDRTRWLNLIFYANYWLKILLVC